MPSIAPLVAGWDKWRSGFAPAPFPGGETPGSITVELFIGTQWIDVTRLDRDTPGVYYRDSIVITRGKADEAATLDRGTCRFTLNNRDGRFSPRNPNSPYYGRIGRNTPVRVSVVQATGVRRYRFYGEISTWPPKWDQSGTDVYVPIEASGILRRLGQGNGSPSSPIYRGLAHTTTGLVAYWPCEDASGSTSIASAVSGVSSMVVSGTPTLASDSTSFVGSSALPVLATGSFYGTLPSYNPNTYQISARFLMTIPAGTATSSRPILTLYTTSDAVARWDVYYLGFSGIDLEARNADGFNVGSSAAALVVDSTPVWVSVELDSFGGSPTVQGRLSIVQPGDTTGQTTTVTVAGTDGLGQATRVSVNRIGGHPSTTFGHLTIQNIITDFYSFGPTLAGSVGEQAGTRLARLCAEDGINYARALPAATTTPALGRQPVSTVTALIQECVDVDMGRLYEPRDQVGFGYRDRASLYDQSAVLALDYAANELAAPLDPVDDDQHTRNDITVTRSGGSSARATRDTGTLSIAAVGRYSETTTLNAYQDTQLPDIAAWKLHFGTTDEARYPTIQLNLLHPTFTGDDAMMTAAHVLDIGDRVTISNPPPWLPPDQISLIVEGYTETIGGNDQHTMALNCSPASPYNVAMYASAVSPTADKYSLGSSTVGTAVSSTATTLSVTVDTTSGNGNVLWTTDAAEFPFDVMVSGERMTVAAISGASSPQSFTVTRSVNGIAKAHAAGESVDLFNPRYYDFGAV